MSVTLTCTCQSSASAAWSSLACQGFVRNPSLTRPYDGRTPVPRRPLRSKGQPVHQDILFALPVAALYLKRTKTCINISTRV